MENEDCYNCIDLKKEGLSDKKINEEHDSCHGWTHCGDECCGACSYCGG